VFPKNEHAGFAWANNPAIRASLERYVHLLNTDAFINGETLGKLQYFEKHYGAGNQRTNAGVAHSHIVIMLIYPILQVLSLGSVRKAPKWHNIWRGFTDNPVIGFIAVGDLG